MMTVRPKAQNYIRGKNNYRNQYIQEINIYFLFAF